NLHGVVNDGVGGAAVQVADESHAAGVAFVFGGIQPLAGREVRGSVGFVGQHGGDLRWDVSRGQAAVGAAYGKGELKLRLPGRGTKKKFTTSCKKNLKSTKM